MHVVFDETGHTLLEQKVHDTDDEEAFQTGSEVEKINEEVPEPKIVIHNNLPKDWRTPKGLSRDNIIGEIDKEFSTRLKLHNYCEIVAYN